MKIQLEKYNLQHNYVNDSPIQRNNRLVHFFKTHNPFFTLSLLSPLWRKYGPSYEKNLKALTIWMLCAKFWIIEFREEAKKMWKVHRRTTGDQKAHLNLRFRLAKSRGVPCQIVNLEQLRRDIFECTKNVPFLKFKSFCFHIKYRIRILMLLKMFISKC